MNTRIVSGEKLPHSDPKSEIAQLRSIPLAQTLSKFLIAAAVTASRS